MNAVRKPVKVQSPKVRLPAETEDFVAPPAEAQASPAIAAQMMLARHFTTEADYVALPQDPTERLIHGFSSVFGVLCYAGGLIATIAFLVRFVA